MALETFLAKTPKKEYAKLQSTSEDDVQLRDVLQGKQDEEEKTNEIKGKLMT